MRPLRRIFQQLERCATNGETDESYSDSSRLELSSINRTDFTAVKRDPIEFDDVLFALDVTRPTNSNPLMKRYQQWETEFGSY